MGQDDLLHLTSCSVVIGISVAVYHMAGLGETLGGPDSCAMQEVDQHAWGGPAGLWVWGGVGGSSWAVTAGPKEETLAAVLAPSHLVLSIACSMCLLGEGQLIDLPKRGSDLAAAVGAARWG
jgi:hypothetical protein